MEEETNQQTNKRKKKGRTDSLPTPKEERARIKYKENQICSIHVSIGVAIIVIGGCNNAVTRTNLKVEMYVPRCIYIPSFMDSTCRHPISDSNWSAVGKIDSPSSSRLRERHLHTSTMFEF